jgi:DnaA-homolog protein
MHPPHQLVLDLIRPLTPTLDNFIVGRNAEAVAALRDLAREPRERFIYLWGSAGAGRTHLLTALAGASDVRSARFDAEAVPAFDPEAAGYVLDDVDRCTDAQQHGLFMLFNEVRARDRGFLVAAGSAPPAQLSLREDLRTRVAWGLVYQLHALTDAEKAQALAAHARSRGLNLAPDVIAYLLTHMPRDMRTLVAIVDALDAYALASRRAITVPLVREWAQASAA